ncbi:hypothetical protein AB5I41_00795 [Sphingomonas sp. MMS24-JH45]
MRIKADAAMVGVPRAASRLGAVRGATVARERPARSGARGEGAAARRQRLLRSWMAVDALSPHQPGPAEAIPGLSALALNAGKPGLVAATESFGDLGALDGEVGRYLARRRMPVYHLALADTPVPPVTMRALRPGETAMVKLRMASTFGVDDKSARPLFAKAAPVAARYPDDAAVQGWLAEMAFDAGDDAAVVAAGERALARDPRSAQAHLYRARADLRRLEAAKDDKPADWAAARKSILAANRLDPDDAEPLWLFYQSFLMEKQTPSKSALAGLYRAQGTEFRRTRGSASSRRWHGWRRARGIGRGCCCVRSPTIRTPRPTIPAARIVAALDAGKSTKEAMALAEAKPAEKKPVGTD